MDGGGRPKGLSKSCVLLIVIAGMERLAFKGVASNLVTYLTDIVKMSNSSAAKTVNNWCGFTSMLPLLLAPLADSYWDRFTTIVASSFIYVLGLVALTSTALARTWFPKSIAHSFSFLFWSLSVISLGQAGYNPSLQAFGTDQLESEEELPSSKDDQESNKKSVFFQWWYFGVCGGSLMGVTIMSYIQDTYGWVLGFAIPTLDMVMSIVIFMCGSRLYTYKQVKDVNTKLFNCILYAIRTTASKIMNRGIRLPDKESDVVELELQGKPLCEGSIFCSKKTHTSGVCMPQNARVVLRLLPIWTMLLMFAVIFQQPATFFTKQGMAMKRNIGSSFKIPPATLQSAITLSIILLMPLYDRALIPMARLITHSEKGISVMQRMGIGMVLSIVAMVIAAEVERKRLRVGQEIKHSETVPLSIFWLLPQYILLGISDIFTVVGMQEFFYSEVPIRMRTMGFALYTSVFGLGSFLSALLITLVEVVTSSGGGRSWFSDDMREARLDKYYWLLTWLSSGSLGIYVILCKFHKTRTDLDDDNS